MQPPATRSPLWRVALTLALAALIAAAVAWALTTPTGPERCATGPWHAGAWPPGCWRPYSGASPFNERIGRTPAVMSSSSRIVAAVLGCDAAGNGCRNLARATHGEGSFAIDTSATPPGNDFGHPTYYNRRTDPVFTISCGCAVDGARVRIPDAARPADGSDHHLTVVDQQGSGYEYDFWDVTRKDAGGGVIAAHGAGRTLLYGDGLHSGATAADFGNLAGIVRAPEIASGHIDHALFMTVGCGTSSAPQFVYPADKAGATCGSPDAPPMGAHFQLALSDDQIAELDVPHWKKTVLTAMAHYGMYVGDTGGGEWGIEAESPATYTSFGEPDPFVAFAASAGVERNEIGQYFFPVAAFGDGIDWGHALRVLCPPRGPCPTAAAARSAHGSRARG